MNISAVKCPSCDKVIPVPPSNSREVPMQCKHCGNSFIASLLGHIDLEETQMSASKKAVKAATKPASKAATTTKPKVPTKTATGDTTPVKERKGKVASYSPAVSKNPKTRSGSRVFDIYASLYSNKKAKTAKEIIAGIPKDRQEGVTEVHVYDAMLVGRGDDTVTCVFK